MYPRKLSILLFKTFLFTTLLLPLSNCGFQPLYQKAEPGVQGNYSADLGLIEIALIPEREGQYLRNAILDQTQAYQTDYIPYILKISLEFDEDDLGLKEDKTPTRTFISVIATYKLVNKADGFVITEGRISKHGQYQQDLSGFNKRLNRKKEIENLLIAIRDQMVRRMVITMRKIERNEITTQQN